MGNTLASGTAGPLIITDADIATNDTAVAYTDGDLVDQPEGGFVAEPSDPEHFVIIPAMLMHRLKTSDQKTFVDANDNEVAAASFDLNNDFVVISLLDGRGNLLPPDSPTRQAAESIDIGTRRAFLVDTSKADTDARSKAGIINASTVNLMLSMPGSRLAFDLNLKIVQERLRRCRKAGESVPITLAMMMCGMLGMGRRVVFLGSPVAATMATHHRVSDVAAERMKTLHTSKAAQLFTKRAWAIAKRFISRIATVSFTRAHTKGGFMIEQSDVLDSSRQPIVPLARGQKAKDSIVARTAALVGLDPAVEAEGNCYYALSKSTADGVVVFSRQFAAAACANNGNVVRESSSVGALMRVAKMKTTSTASSFALRVEWTVVVGGYTLTTPFLVTPPDLACGPRRDGGSLESRGLIRAFEKLLRYGPLGLPIVAGIMPEAEAVRTAGMMVSQAPHLAHPAVSALIPANAKALYMKACAATTKRAISIVTCVTYHFELGRHGKDYMSKANLVKSEQKAVSTYGPTYGTAAENYGKVYAAAPPESKVYKLLVKQATKGVGALSENSTEDEVKQALDGYMQTFLSADDLFDSSNPLVASTIADAAPLTNTDGATRALTVSESVPVAPTAAPTGLPSMFPVIGTFFGARGTAAVSAMSELLGVSDGTAARAEEISYKDRFAEISAAVSSEDMIGIRAIMEAIVGTTTNRVNFVNDFPELVIFMREFVADVGSETPWYKELIATAKEDAKSTDSDTGPGAIAFMSMGDSERFSAATSQAFDSVNALTEDEAQYASAFVFAVSAASATINAKGLARSALRSQKPELLTRTRECASGFLKLGSFEYP